MGKELFEKYGIRQLGYSVESIEETAQLYHDLFGAGPFIDMGVNAPESCKIRGVEQPVKMRTAIGYLGDMEIELIEDKSDCPSPYSEAGRYGLHHYCIWVDDVQEAVDEFAAAGIEVAMDMVSGSGMRVAYVDAREQLGQYIEVNPPLEQVRQMGMGVHQKWPDDVALVGIQDVMAMMGR